jgi:prepilin-type N-terminal cleavage/methylation domain-containing protein
MKIKFPIFSRLHAFTLSEVMVVMAIFSTLVLTIVSAQVYGLRMYTISETKLTVSADARVALNRIRDEIRSGKLLYVGNGDENEKNFQFIADNSPHQGNALRICATTDTNRYVYYYVDTNQFTLNRKYSGRDVVQVLARNITNQIVFRAEDFQGNVLTNYVNNRVIRMSLHFYQREYAANGSGGLYDYYQLQTKIARRTRE